MSEALLPEHIIAELTVIVGLGFTVTVVVLTFVQLLLLPVTVYTVVTEGVGLIMALVAPVLQVYEEAPDAMSVTEFPEHIVAGFTTTVGVVLTVTVAVLLVEHPVLLPVTV